MHFIWMTFISALLMFSPIAQTTAQAPDRPVVVELFTSQGCNSCPPADRLLGELADRDDVIALAFHVDYWDYIGWKDRFALAAARLRQQAYAKSMHARHIFTPQLIVAGNTSVVGSDRDAVEHAIKAAHKTSEGQPPASKITLTRGAKEVTLTLSESMQSPPANIWLLAYDDRHVTQIPRGENAGRTLIDHHAVRAIVNLGTWDGTETSRQIAARHWPADSDYLAIVLQVDNHGRILAAATLPLREIP